MSRVIRPAKQRLVVPRRKFLAGLGAAIAAPAIVGRARPARAQIAPADLAAFKSPYGPQGLFQISPVNPVLNGSFQFHIGQFSPGVTMFPVIQDGLTEGVPISYATSADPSILA